MAISEACIYCSKKFGNIWMCKKVTMNHVQNSEVKQTTHFTKWVYQSFTNSAVSNVSEQWLTLTASQRTGNWLKIHVLVVDSTFRYLQIFSVEDFSCRLVVPSWCLANKHGSKYICCNLTYISDFKFMKEHRPEKKSLRIIKLYWYKR